jgi:hypothetical protein
MLHQHARAPLLFVAIMGAPCLIFVWVAVPGSAIAWFATTLVAVVALILVAVDWDEFFKWHARAQANAERAERRLLEAIVRKVWRAKPDRPNRDDLSALAGSAQVRPRTSPTPIRTTWDKLPPEGAPYTITRVTIRGKELDLGLKSSRIEAPKEQSSEAPHPERGNGDHN